MAADAPGARPRLVERLRLAVVDGDLVDELGQAAGAGAHGEAIGLAEVEAARVAAVHLEREDRGLARRRERGAEAISAVGAAGELVDDAIGTAVAVEIVGVAPRGRRGVGRGRDRGVDRWRGRRVGRAARRLATCGRCEHEDRPQRAHQILSGTKSLPAFVAAAADFARLVTAFLYCSARLPLPLYARIVSGHACPFLCF